MATNTLEENAIRIKLAKQALKGALEAKGVTVPEGETLSNYYTLVSEIPTGGSVDLSFVTAKAKDILQGKIGADATGKPVYGTFIQGGGTTTGLFDVAKVSAYSPYSPAYPSQLGYSFDINYIHSENGNVVKNYEYSGLYTVTEETKGNVGFGRVFKNESGKYLYAYSYTRFDKATDEDTSAYWCLADTLGMPPESTYIYTDEVSTGAFPDSVTNWYSMGYTLSSCTVNKQITSDATDAIPLVLECNKVTGYSYDTKDFVVGTDVTTYQTFDIEPIVDWFYVATGSHLIGTSIGSAVPQSLYVSFEAAKEVAETGQSLYFGGTHIWNTIEGVPCVTYDGAEVDVLASDFLVVGDTPFAVCAFVRVDTETYSNCHLCQGYNSSLGGGFEICLMNGSQLYIRGGGISGDGYNTVNTYVFPRKKWVHVCYTYNNGWNTVYIDGKKIWQNFVKRKFPEPSESVFTIGNTIDRREFWYGSIAEFKYFSNVISPMQIKKEADRCLNQVYEDKVPDDYKGNFACLRLPDLPDDLLPGGNGFTYFGGDGYGRYWSNGSEKLFYNGENGRWEITDHSDERLVYSYNVTLSLEGWSNGCRLMYID